MFFRFLRLSTASRPRGSRLETVDPGFERLGPWFPLRLAGLCALLACAACGPRIGDPCENSVECAPQTRDRYCDSSYLVDGEGECTIWGCVGQGCPDEATCVMTFNTSFATQSCDPSSEGQGAQSQCQADELCLPDGLCADRHQGRSSCRLICERDKDCREGYRCRPTGEQGLYIAPDPTRFVWEGRGASICVPAPASPKQDH